jgi:hypothetical protein
VMHEGAAAQTGPSRSVGPRGRRRRHRRSACSSKCWRRAQAVGSLEIEILISGQVARN